MEQKDWARLRIRILPLFWISIFHYLSDFNNLFFLCLFLLCIIIPSRFSPLLLLTVFLLLYFLVLVFDLNLIFYVLYIINFQQADKRMRNEKAHNSIFPIVVLLVLVLVLILFLTLVLVFDFYLTVLSLALIFLIFFVFSVLF